MDKSKNAFPLYLHPRTELYELVRMERDRLGMTKDQLTPIALAFFGGKMPEPLTPANLINLTYHLRTL